MLSIKLFLVFLPLFGAAMSQKVKSESWGTTEGKEVFKYTLKNAANQEVDVVSYGAIIAGVRTPDKNGKFVDVALGFDDLNGYLTKDRGNYIGATMGRAANRIANARFMLDGTEYNLYKNIPNHTLHGGKKGWSFVPWDSSVENDTVVMTLLSKDGDEGYPGDVIASVTFRLLDDGTLEMIMKAFTTKATIVNLTNHAYFNLAGHATDSTELYKHVVHMNADRWTVTDEESIPTGEIRAVDGVMDFRSPKMIGDVIKEVPRGGYDWNFCITDGEKGDEERLVAEVVHPESGRFLEIHSNQPGVQFYTSNNLPGSDKAGVAGKEGSQYFKHGSFCLETQNYPDAIHHDNFPNSVLRPGQVYNHVVKYKFGTK